MSAFGILASLLIICRGVLPLQVKYVWKILLSFAVLLAAFKFQISRLLGGPMFFAPDLPGGVILFGSWCFSAVFLYFFILLFTETVWLVLRLCRRKIPRKITNRCNGITLALTVLIAALGLIQGRALPEAKRVRLEFSELPKEAENMTVAVLADLHADNLTGAERIGEIVRRTNALKPDMVLILGDFVDGRVNKCGQSLEPLSKLSAPLGVYAVPGNHEYYSGGEEWIKFLTKQNIKFLLNSHVQLPNKVVLAGITDSAARRFHLPMPDMDKAVAGVPEKSFVILLAHRPFPLKEAAKRNIALTLSGHTHGGMVTGMDLLVAGFNHGYVSGLYEYGNARLYVSDGTSIWNGFPVRLGHPPEITLLTFTGK